MHFVGSTTNNNNGRANLIDKKTDFMLTRSHTILSMSRIYITLSLQCNNAGAIEYIDRISLVDRIVDLFEYNNIAMYFVLTSGQSTTPPPCICRNVRLRPRILVSDLFSNLGF